MSLPTSHELEKWAIDCIFAPTADERQTAAAKLFAAAKLALTTAQRANRQLDALQHSLTDALEASLVDDLKNFKQSFNEAFRSEANDKKPATLVPPRPFLRVITQQSQAKREQLAAQLDEVRASIDADIATIIDAPPEGA